MHSVNVHVNTKAKGNPMKAMWEGSTRLALASLLGPFVAHWSTFLYITSCAWLWSSFHTVHLSTLWDQLGGWMDRPSQRMRYVISDMSVLTNSPSKQNTLHSPIFRSSLLATCHLPTVLRQRAKDVIGSAPTNQQKDWQSTAPSNNNNNNNTNKKSMAYILTQVIYHLTLAQRRIC